MRHKQYFPPMLAVSGRRLPPGSQWIHEIKLDGVRVLTLVEGDRVQFLSRRGNPLPALGRWADEVAERVRPASAVLDGEVVAFADDGRPCFTTLMALLRRGRFGGSAHRFPLCLYLFDLLHCGGRDLRHRALTARREVLRSAVRWGGLLRRSAAVGGERGEQFLRAVDALGYEGVVSKDATSGYTAGRSSRWRKLPLRAEGRFFIHAVREGKRGLTLSLGVRGEDGGLRPTGAVVLPESRREDLLGHGCADHTGAGGAGCGTRSQPVNPMAAARVHYTEITPAGGLRHPMYGGLIPFPGVVCAWTHLEKNRARRRKTGADPDTSGSGEGRDIRLADLLQPHGSGARLRVGGDILHLSNLDRSLGGEWNMSKLDALDYYWTVRRAFLRHVAGRPLLLTRYPRGAAGEGFYQRRPPEPRPSRLQTVRLGSGEGQEGAGRELVLCGDEQTLLWLINLGAYEIHPLPETGDRRRDVIILDLDPAGRTDSREVVLAAQVTEQMLGRAGLRSWVKTSGGRGVHIVIPLARPYPSGQVTEAARIMGKILTGSRPHLFTLERTRMGRDGKVYVDYLQNRRGATVVAPYCMRMRRNPGVSVPLLWSEVYAARGRGLPQHTPASAAQRYRRWGDPWAGLPEEEGYGLRDLLRRLRTVVEGS